MRMKPYHEMTFKELHEACTCTEAALDGEAASCEACFVAGALGAGIPRSVVARQTKLTDHFSTDYIDFQRGMHRHGEQGEGDES
jgi:hypothetical protein